jgi:hypothetical protein
MTTQHSETSAVPTGPLDDLLADLDAEQLKSLVLHLFSTTKNPAFRANVKAWRKSQKLPKTV